MSLWDGAVLLQIVNGFSVTLLLAAVVLPCALAVAIAANAANSSGIRPLVAVATAYVTLFRHTPPLCQLLLLYFGVRPFLGQDLSAFGWASVSVSLFAAAFAAEALRAGFDALPTALEDAGTVLGLSRLQRFHHIALPLAL